jgi:hypothetical protein
VKGFTTPLATLHKFQGWADKFLTTPVNGLADLYVNAGYTRKGVGPLAPVANNDSEDGRARNRRVELVKQ